MIEKTPANWAPIVGRWSFQKGRVTYTGPDEDSPLAYGICLTDLRLTEGTVSCRVQFTEASAEGRILLGYRSLNERYVMAGLGGWKRAYTVGEYVPSFAWRGLALAGAAENLIPQQWYSQSVEVNGQRLQLSVDTVRVLQHVFDKPATSGQVGLFAFGRSPVEFENFVVRQRPGKVFVVMQFSEPYRQLYEEVIQPVVKTFDLCAYHVGEVFGPGIILNDIAQGIVEAEVVIAEITPANQNVFYELGYSHALNKPTILLAERGKQLPFDVSGYRVLFYDNTIAGKKQIEDGLRKHLEAILRE
ncbi:MAG TPA: hypothetical protein VMJ93_02290 [Verrucomicrobiae bacterium]|nr:hypothetical protein [Verrucomicrobiae bacterium]HUN63797.1 hypothetical protein [Candidatus Sulfotelmatobacter sp.]